MAATATETAVARGSFFYLRVVKTEKVCSDRENTEQGKC